MNRLAASTLLLLAVAACSNASSSEPPNTSALHSPVASGIPSASNGITQATPMVVKDFTLDPMTLSVHGSVSLAVTNEGPTIHNVAIRDASATVLGATKDLKTGESETLTANLPAGSYTLFCSLPGHESLGVKGTLTVSK